MIQFHNVTIHFIHHLSIDEYSNTLCGFTNKVRMQFKELKYVTFTNWNNRPKTRKVFKRRDIEGYNRKNKTIQEYYENQNNLKLKRYNSHQKAVQTRSSDDE